MRDSITRCDFALAGELKLGVVLYQTGAAPFFHSV
jgi:hypothetical protein